MARHSSQGLNDDRPLNKFLWEDFDEDEEAQINCARERRSGFKYLIIDDLQDISSDNNSSDDSDCENADDDTPNVYPKVKIVKPSEELEDDSRAIDVTKE